MTRPKFPESVTYADLQQAFATLGIDNLADVMQVIINPHRMLLECVQRDEDGHKNRTSSGGLAMVTVVLEITRP